MLGIVRNRAIDVLRSKAGRAPKLDFDDDSILEHRPAAELTDDEALQRETAHEVRGAIGELPGEQSKVIELAYFGGFSHSEIAGDAGRAAGHREGADATRVGEDSRRAGGGTGMSETDHERWRDELAAYLLGALEPGEAAELERHLAGCAECRAELRLAAAGGAAAARVGGAGRGAAGAARRG